MLKIQHGKVSKPVSALKDYSKHLETHPISALTTVENKADKGPWTGGLAEEETVHPGLFTSASGMKVTIEGGRTISLGNFEFARIGVTLTVPCDPAGLMDAYNFGTEFVAQRMDEEIAKATGKPMPTKK